MHPDDNPVYQVEKLIAGHPPKQISYYRYHLGRYLSKFKEPQFLLKVFSFLLFTIICLSQCWSILSDFFQYPMIINTYDRSPSLITILPGLTLCNNNRVSIRKLAKLNETLRKQLESRFPNWRPNNRRELIERAEFERYRDELSKLFDQLNFSPSDLTEVTSMNDLFDMRPDDEPFIEWLGCARTWSETVNCGRLTRLDSLTNRRCSTILHRGAMLNDVQHRPELFHDSSYVAQLNRTSFDSSMYDFSAKEVIKILINFEPEDYGDLKRQIGARISFHDNNYVAAASDLDFFITRGNRYDFNIDRRDTKLLGEPYDECFDYDEANLNSYRHHIEPRVPLSSSTCFQNCVVRNVLRWTNCWPPTIPYFRNDSLDPNLSTKICAWFRGSQHTSVFKEILRVEQWREWRRSNKHNNTVNIEQPVDDEEAKVVFQRMKTYKKIRRFCWSQCVLSCKLTAYGVTLTKSTWPTDVNILLDKTGGARARRHCCALITIKYAHYHYNVHEYQPKHQVADTIGDIGGLLAVWLGLSIVSVYQFVNKLIGFFNWRRHGRDNNNNCC